MSDFREIPLGDVIDIFDHIREPLSAAQRASRKGPYPYYGAQSIIDHIDNYIFDGRYLLIPEDGENLNSRKLPIAYFADGKFWVNNHAHIVRGRLGVVDDVFLKHAINALDISGYVTGAAQPKLNQANLRRIKLLLPSLQTQRRIASILGAYDDLIEVNRWRVAVLEEMARGLFEEWFVRFRFPGHKNVPILDTADGPLPEGWTTGVLANLLQLEYGKALKSDTRLSGAISVYGSSGLVGQHNVALVQGPGIIVGRKGNVGSVIWSPKDFWPIDTVFYVKSEYPLQYLYHQLGRLPFQNTDAAVPGLNRGGALKIPLVKPPVEQCEEYDRIVTPIVALRDQLLETNKALAASRDLLLPRLISGQLSVASAERELEEVA